MSRSLALCLTVSSAVALTACVSMTETLATNPEFAFVTAAAPDATVDCITEHLSGVSWVGMNLPAPVASRSQGAYQITFAGDPRMVVTVAPEAEGSRVEFRSQGVVVPGSVRPAVEACRT